MTYKLIALASVSLVAIVGCGSKGADGGSSYTTVAPDGSKVKVSSGKGNEGVTIEGKGVSGSFGGATTVTEADVHVPFYPGATVENDKSIKVKTEKEESAMVYLTTKDDAQKVKDFYKEKVIGIEFAEMTSSGGVTIIGQTKSTDGVQHAITIMKPKPDEPTAISIGYSKQTK